MTVRNLNHLCKPGAVALIGASDDPRSVGGVLARNLREGGFAGRIMLVNPNHAEIEGEPCHPDAASLPATPDLAVVATPPATLPGIIAELGARGTKAAVVITAGLGEGGKGQGGALRQAMLDAARPHLLRIVGPNSFGILVPEQGLNATFAPVSAKPGRLALVTQSGAVMSGVLDWASARAVGFSHLISVGDMADVDFGDLLDYLAQDAKAAAILLYMEAVTAARKFMSAARAASRLKPVIVLKAGRHAEGARAIASHTGALAGSDAVHEAAFRRAGMLRVANLLELFDAAAILASSPVVKGDRLAILTNGGGFGVLATDGLIDEGGRLAELAPETLRRLDAVLPPTWSRANPVDIIGDAPGRRYADALGPLLEDPGVEALLVLNCPTAIASSLEAAQAVGAAIGPRPRLPVLASWVGDSAQVIEARRALEAHRVPVYDTPGQAVRAFMYLVRHRRSQEALIETPPSVPEAFTPDVGAARQPIERALAAGRDWLSEPEAKAVLAAYDLPVVPTATATSVAEALAVAHRIGFPVALKILSPDITHKSDVGGVALGLADEQQLQTAAEAMLARAAAALPQARVVGFTVQPMVRRPHAQELILGASVDPQFGPVLLFGQGGTAAELIADRALALPPLNMRLARDLMAQTRVHRLLQGYRDRPAADLDAVALALIKLAQLVIDVAEVAEVDVNPLLADQEGVIALDARIRVAKPAPERRLAIQPYPAELEDMIQLADGRALLLRPIRPEDEPMLIAAFHKLSPESVRLRFFAPIKELTHRTAAALTQIDYDRQMALVLADPAPAGVAQLYGVARISADPDNERAEFALTVRDDMTGMGLGSLLMRRLIDYARNRGLQEIFGHVLQVNWPMLAIARRLGFEETADRDEPELKLVTLRL
ncbi:MAG TPA: bifunctional acetate--CoA ligase family protein/GNAT family N-acetyltransferase [Geminicoccaceae bacterium]|nr:bifunctional acetate--CoA ligase family protein/GNAT family N-acetyltransferase [Geminicoccaceae bacterium]